MQGRERVRRAVLFQHPDRVPRALPEPWGTDFFDVGIGENPNWQPRIKTEEKWEDEWGCVWEKLPGDLTMGQVKVYPLKDYDRLREFKFPNYDIPERYQAIPERLRDNKENKFVLAHAPISFIHRLHYLRGFSESMMDPYVNPKELHELLDILADIAIQSIKRLAPFGIDGIMSADDWGFEDKAFVKPAIFKEFFKPVYKKVYHFAHQHNILTFLHSCGHISELLEDFIEAELDLIQMDQQENMGVDTLAKNFGGRLCFWCPVDIQKTMVTGSLEDIRNYAKDLIEKLGKFNGGFIAKWYPSPQAVNHSQEKISAMAEAFVKYGDYSQYRKEE